MPQDQSVRCIEDHRCDGEYFVYPGIVVRVAHHCDRMKTTIFKEFPSIVHAMDWLAATGRLREHRTEV